MGMFVPVSFLLGHPVYWYYATVAVLCFWSTVWYFEVLYNQKNFRTAKHKCWLPGHLVSCNTHEIRHRTHAWCMRVYNTPLGPVTSTCVSQCQSTLWDCIVEPFLWSSFTVTVGKVIDSILLMLMSGILRQNTPYKDNVPLLIQILLCIYLY